MFAKHHLREYKLGSKRQAAEKEKAGNVCQKIKGWLELSRTAAELLADATMLPAVVGPRL